MYEIIILLLVLIIIKYAEISYIIKKLPNKIKIAICKNSNILIIKLIRFLNKKHLKIIKKLGNHSIDNQNKYKVLSPNDNAPIDGYSQMLQIALQTSGTNNIAVTGTYGSGKSSFLRTFEKNHVEWNYLHISLATFAEAKNGIIEPDSSTGTTTKENQHKLIERSILQQIFYKEKDKVIPFSRFKRIINIKNRYLILHTILLSLLIFYSLSMFYPTKVQEFINYDLNLRLKKYYWVFFIAISISTYYLYKIIEYSTKLKVNKFNLKNGEFQLDGKDNSSILNENLDEILYFFEVTSYDVVVIEDLDRFDSTEIFIKLRELNTLINNSKDINRRIIFIYAIRDDMFKNKDRTKFFEFIVPIIPYINSRTSFLKLKEKFKNEKEIDENFLRDVSIRINDMRLLLNISNEYKIYKHKINSKGINKNGLLAMIIYKNFYPADFAKLHKNKGMIPTIFNNRTSYINSKLDELNNNIKEKQEKINEYETKIKLEKEKSIDELKMVYILNIFKYSQNNNGYISLSDSDSDSFHINNFEDLLKNEIFDKVKNEKFKFDFKDIENKINDKLSYNQREEIILKQNNKNLENLKQELQDLKDKQKEIKEYTISKIAKEDDSEIFKNIENEDLLKFLLKDGYIREDEYHNYISNFFEGGLSYNDREFVLSVQNNKIFEFDYLLFNIKEVMIHLKAEYFESKSILNYSLLDYMIENDIKDDKFNNFINILIKNEDNRDFIFNYINFSKYLKEFIEIISDRWAKIWFFIYKESQFTEEKKDTYFQILFDHLEIDNLMKLNIEDSLKEYIETSQKVPDNSNFNDRFKQLIKTLKVKYQNIDDTYDENPAFFEFIYEENLYKLNEKMINKIIFIKGEPRKTSEEKLKISHYTTIKESEAQELKKYLEANINEYIENVFLQIETNIKEDEQYIIELLNNEDLEFENKQSIIEKEEAKICDISQIKNKELWDVLFDKNKVTAIWKNILNYYQYKEQNLDEIIIDFISNKENYKQLSNNIIYNEEEFEEKVIENLSLHLITFNELNDECYSYITKSLYRYSVFLTKLTNEKIDILLKNNKLTLTQENINYLKEQYSNKQIVLFENLKEDLLKEDPLKEDPLKEDNKFILDENDYIGIFKSTKFTLDEKMRIINKLDLNIFDNEELVKIVIDIYLDDKIEVSNELFFKFFEKGNFEDSLQLLINQIPNLENQVITELLSQLGEPYDKLILQSEEPLTLDKVEIDKDLLIALKNKGFIKNVKFQKKEVIVYK